MTIPADPFPDDPELPDVPDVPEEPDVPEPDAIFRNRSAGASRVYTVYGLAGTSRS